MTETDKNIILDCVWDIRHFISRQKITPESDKALTDLETLRGLCDKIKTTPEQGELFTDWRNSGYENEVTSTD